MNNRTICLTYMHTCGLSHHLGMFLGNNVSSYPTMVPDYSKTMLHHTLEHHELKFLVRLMVYCLVVYWHLHGIATEQYQPYFFHSYCPSFKGYVGVSLTGIVLLIGTAFQNLLCPVISLRNQGFFVNRLVTSVISNQPTCPRG